MEQTEETATTAHERVGEPRPDGHGKESASTPVVRLTGVGKCYPANGKQPRRVVLSGVSLEIPDTDEGQFVVLIGPSGCGKSTILHMISGLLEPDEGEVFVFGKKVLGPSPQAVTVQQSYTCFPWLTVGGNVRFGLALQGKSKSEQEKTANEYLVKVGLGDRQDAYPSELSGGMQQRVAIARTLAVKPSIVLMDEPFGALDAQTRSEMQQMLLDIWQDEKNTIVFVTHDITEAVLLADRIIVLAGNPTGIVLDRAVPFPRPRKPSLVMEAEFIRWCQVMLHTLQTNGRSVTDSGVKASPLGAE